MKIFVFIVTLIFVTFYQLLSQSLPCGENFLVNTNTHWDQSLPSIAPLINGGAIVCWQNWKYQGIHGQLYNTEGTRRGNEFAISTYQSNIYHENPYVIGLSTGKCVVCWWSSDYEQDKKYIGQILNPDGSKDGSAFQVNTTSGVNWTKPNGTALKDGGFVMCWEKYTADHIQYSMGQIFDSTGTTTGPEFLVNTDTLHHPYHMTSCTLENGNFVICWTQFSMELSDYADVYGQIFNPEGNKVGENFIVHHELRDYQSFQSIASCKNGGFVVIWEHAVQDELYKTKLNGQFFDSNGNKTGSGFTINTRTFTYQFNSVVTQLVSGDFIAIWQGRLNESDFYSGIFGQLFDENGQKKYSEFVLSHSNSSQVQFPQIAALHEDRYLACWQGQDVSSAGIYGMFLKNEPVVHELQSFVHLQPLNDATFGDTAIEFQWQQATHTHSCYPFEVTYNLLIDTTFTFSNYQRNKRELWRLSRSLL